MVVMTGKLTFSRNIGEISVLAFFVLFLLSFPSISLINVFLSQKWGICESQFPFQLKIDQIFKVVAI